MAHSVNLPKFNLQKYGIGRKRDQEVVPVHRSTYVFGFLDIANSEFYVRDGVLGAFRGLQDTPVTI